MFYNKKFISQIIILTLLTTFFTGINESIAATTITKPKKIAEEITIKENYINVNPLEVVATPQKYLNKNIRIKGTFDKFSVVGLDYKPAYRSSEDYILFLIKRTEIKGHIIPLAEMKIFMTRKMAEKYIDLETGDEIEFTGKVFSTALSDPWIEIDSLKILNKVKKENTEENENNNTK